MLRKTMIVLAAVAALAGGVSADALAKGGCGGGGGDAASGGGDAAPAASAAAPAAVTNPATLNIADNLTGAAPAAQAIATASGGRFSAKRSRPKASSSTPAAAST